MKKKKTEGEKETQWPARLPKHYYPGYAFIPKAGYYQARRIGLTKETVQADPRFHKTRLQAREFTQIIAWGKIIREACCAGTGIKSHPHRLNGALGRIMQEDPVSKPGARELLYGGIHHLETFNFNKDARLEDICLIDWDLECCYEKKEVRLAIPSFVPLQYIRSPQGIGYGRIYMTTVGIHIVNGTFERHTTRTTIFPMRNIHIPATTLKATLFNEKDMVYIVTMGISWYTKDKAGSRIMPADTAGPLQVITAG